MSGLMSVGQRSEARLKVSSYLLKPNDGYHLDRLEASARFGSLIADHQRLTEALDVAMALVYQLVDEDDCSLDHHGYCQAHGWFGSDADGEPCAHRIGKELLASYTESGKWQDFDTAYFDASTTAGADR